MDAVLDHPTSGEDYGPGAIVGVNLFITIDPNAAPKLQPTIWVLILPEGIAVPTLSTEAQIKSQERYIWYVRVPDSQPGPSATNPIYKTSITVETKRRFERGDHFVVVVRNDTGAPWGASASQLTEADLYLQER